MNSAFSLSFLLLHLPCMHFFCIIHEDWQFSKDPIFGKEYVNWFVIRCIAFVVSHCHTLCCKEVMFYLCRVPACSVWGLTVEGSVWMWVGGDASGWVQAVMSVWPCSGHVCEYTACVRNIEIGRIVCGCLKKMPHMQSPGSVWNRLFTSRCVSNGTWLTMLDD